jgi:hypothetical protein
VTAGEQIAELGVPQHFAVGALGLAQDFLAVGDEQQSWVPAFDITPAQPPFVADASGLPIDVPGTSFLRIHFPFATGMGSYSGPTAFAGPGGTSGILTALVRAGDYEGVLTWIAGSRSPFCYRVSILGAPTRVVIDVQRVAG